MKTPEELAEEHSTKYKNELNKCVALSSFLAGYAAGFKAGQGRTDHELMEAYFDMKCNESFGMKLAVFVNGLRKGLKRIKDYENT